MRIYPFTTCVAVFLAGLTGVAVASETEPTTLDWPVGESLAYRLDSGTHANATTQYQTAFEAVVHVPEAAWLRLHFERANLEGKSFVRITSMLDGEVQELDSFGISMWSNTSAYFNGDVVIVELVAAPNTSNNRVRLSHVTTQLGIGGSERACGANGCGYCSGDDRLPSAEVWTGRLLPVGCTGSIYNVSSCTVTAGHCVDDGNANVIQFNVPQSNGSCGLNNPPIADQFPILEDEWQNTGVGGDWAVLLVGTNNLGQTPYERYGELRSIAGEMAQIGDPARVTGYGVDDSPDPTFNQTQQTNAGNITQVGSNQLRYEVDVTYGNSGSALIHDDEIVGIVSHCPCPNIATRIDVPAFAAARYGLCPEPYCDATSLDTAGVYVQRVQLADLDASTGSAGYVDNTGELANVGAGDTNTLTITTADTPAGALVGAWLDLNLDFDYDDPGEQIGMWTADGSGATQTFATDFALASNFPRVVLRLRVRVVDPAAGDALTSCGDALSGEVEDYSVVVDEAIDLVPPTPNPMAFYSTGPWVNECTEIGMVAAAGFDFSFPVSYYFEATGGPGASDSGWQTSRFYYDDELVPGYTYTYRVKARDSAPTQNETEFSAPAEIYLPPCASGDADDNGALDFADFARLQLCYDQAASGGCAAMDLDGSGTIGFIDFESLAILLEGPQGG